MHIATLVVMLVLGTAAGSAFPYDENLAVRMTEYSFAAYVRHLLYTFAELVLTSVTRQSSFVFFFPFSFCISKMLRHR